MKNLKAATRFVNGAWEVWGLVRDEQGGLATRLILRTTDLDEALDAEAAYQSPR